MPILSNSDLLAIPPGETIRERLTSLAMTPTDLAQQWDSSEDTIHQLLVGDLPITAKVAHQSEISLGVPSSFWINLEAIYRNTLREIQAASVTP